ncbi:MAG: ATP-dependent RNA helicase RhlB, partial [Pseudoxanthomonas sp.]
PSGDGKPRAPRPPRSVNIAASGEAPAPAQAVPVASVAAVAGIAPAPGSDATRPPRKRRRRRHGVPIEGAVAASPAAQPQPSAAQASKPAADNSSFLTKLGRKLKSLVSGSCRCSFSHREKVARSDG